MWYAAIRDAEQQQNPFELFANLWRFDFKRSIRLIVAITSPCRKKYHHATPRAICDDYSANCNDH